MVNNLNMIPSTLSTGNNFQCSTVADVAHVSYVAEAKSAGINIKQFPALSSWYTEMLQRPAVVRGLNMLKQHGMSQQ
jgi:glutathione S-transferase